MKSRKVINAGLIIFLGLFTILGSTYSTLAQNRRDGGGRPPQNSAPNHDRGNSHQDFYQQQKVQNQQRFEQRQQNYQDFHQQRMQQQIPNQPQVSNQPQPNPSRERNMPSQIPQQNIPNRQNRQSQYVLPSPQFAQRQLSDRERQQWQSQIGNWDKSEHNWQGAYNNRWTQSQNLFAQQSRLLQQQRRLAQYSFQQAYWDRVREDHDRLQGWQFYNDVALNYSYLRGGRYYYTSQYGVNMLQDAVNDGYQEGFLAGQADREDNYRYDFNDAFAYQDATYGYNGYWVDLGEYQYYFRKGFQDGYDDGFYNRYRYGTFADGKYAINANILGGLFNFTAVF